tara:strand:+ start:626 stop:1372 length:747 start_codon:yes stop_codon:yes gene_type:complete
METRTRRLRREVDDVINNEDIACVIMSHVQSARDRCALARVSRVFRDADTRAASLPDRLGPAMHAPCGVLLYKQARIFPYLMQHDGILDLPKERIEGLLRFALFGPECFLYGPGHTLYQDSVCWWAAVTGQLELLKWARAHEYSWDLEIPNADVDEENWPRDILTIQGIAAQRGQLEVLKWARENGAPLCPFICEFACEGHQFEVLEWAVMNRVEDWEAHVPNYEEALKIVFGGASESEESEDSRSGV